VNEHERERAALIYGNELDKIDSASSALLDIAKSAECLGLSELARRLMILGENLGSAHHAVKANQSAQEANINKAIAIAIQQSSIASFNATQQGLAQGLSQDELFAFVRGVVNPWQAIVVLLEGVLGVEIEPEQPIGELGWTMGVPPDLEENTDIELLLHDGTATEGMTWRHYWSSSSPELWDVCVISDCDQANSDGFLDTDLIKGWRLK
jgi:hypothetical protein